MNGRRRDPAWCFGVLGIAKAPWRPTRLEAEADAVDAGHGWWCEHPVPPGKIGKIYLDALAEIWTTNDLVPALPRKVTPPSVPKLPRDHSDSLSRIDRIIARREGKAL